MKAWQLIQEPYTWTRCVAARTAQGLPCDSYSKAATCWCALGAIIKCYRGEAAQDGVIAKLCRYLETVLLVPRYQTDFDHDVVGRWNDAPERTHREVLNTLKLLMI